MNSLIGGMGSALCRSGHSGRGAYYTHVDGYELDTCGDDVWIRGGANDVSIAQEHFSVEEGRRSVRMFFP